MPKQFRNKLIDVECPECHYSFSVDTDSDESDDAWKTSPETQSTSGDDPDNTGNENSMNTPTPQDSLARALIAAAQKNQRNPQAKAEKPLAKPANEQSAAGMLASAMAEARAKLIRK